MLSSVVCVWGASGVAPHYYSPLMFPFVMISPCYLTNHMGVCYDQQFNYFNIVCEKSCFVSVLRTSLTTTIPMSLVRTHVTDFEAQWLDVASFVLMIQPWECRADPSRGSAPTVSHTTLSTEKMSGTSWTRNSSCHDFLLTIPSCNALRSMLQRWHKMTTVSKCAKSE